MESPPPSSSPEVSIASLGRPSASVERPPDASRSSALNSIQSHDQSTEAQKASERAKIPMRSLRGLKRVGSTLSVAGGMVLGILRGERQMEDDVSSDDEQDFGKPERPVLSRNLTLKSSLRRAAPQTADDRSPLRSLSAFQLKSQDQIHIGPCTDPSPTASAVHSMASVSAASSLREAPVRRPSIDRFSQEAWAEWEMRTEWGGKRRSKKHVVNHDLPSHDEYPNGHTLEAQTEDMTLQDLERLSSNFEDDTLHDLSETRWTKEDTPTHSICRKEDYLALLKRLRTDPYKVRVQGQENILRGHHIYVDPMTEVVKSNNVGQLPLHIACQAVRWIEERDGSKRRMETVEQDSPDLVTVLLTGRDLSNGHSVFKVQKDKKGNAMGCMHQDSCGMTPLHAACLSEGSAACEIVARLLEAHPGAAGVRDMDGLYPLDIVCRSPHNGASEICKMLLRAHPQAAIVGEDETDLKEAWGSCLDETITPLDGGDEYGVFPDDGMKRDMKPETSYVDTVLSCVADGIDVGTDTHPPKQRSSSFGRDIMCVDLRFMQPQRIMVQQMLVEVSNVYRPGNISIPGPLKGISSSALRARLVEDLPSMQVTNLELMRQSFHRTFRRTESVKSSDSGATNNSRISKKGFRKGRILQPEQVFRPPIRGILGEGGRVAADEDRDEYIKSKFAQYDVDNHGCIDYEDVFSGFARVGAPITIEEAEEIVVENDPMETGVLSFDNFDQVAMRISQVDDMVKGVQKRWEDSSEHKACDNQGVIYFCKHTNCRITTTQVQKCVSSAKMQDPAGPLATLTPHRAEECFYEDELQRRREERPQTQGRRGPPAWINQRQLIKRLLEPDRCLQSFARLPLHFACANSANPEAGVMVRDLLYTYGRAARIRDGKGRLPLHLACMNESYACVCMVKLLLDEYPEGATIADNDGELPLHLCLRHNHGDGTLHLVHMLLTAHKGASAEVSGASFTNELPLHLALHNYCKWSEFIITALVEAYPAALAITDAAGASVLHRFAWIEHPSPQDAERALERDRGISGALRAPNFEKDVSSKFRTAYDPLLMLETLTRCADRYCPSLMHMADQGGALPLHYVCQNSGTFARAIASELLRLHPASAYVQDLNGNTALHLALGSFNSSCAEVVADQQATNLLSIPNGRNQLAAEVPGAWDISFFFKVPSVLSSLIHALLSLSSPTLAGINIYLSVVYYQHDLRTECVLALLPLGVLATVITIMDIRYSLDQRYPTWTFIEASLGNMFSWLQLRIPLLGLSTLSWTTGRGRGASGAAVTHRRLRLFFLLKTIEMVAVSLPVAVLHAVMFIRGFVMPSDVAKLVQQSGVMAAMWEQKASLPSEAYWWQQIIVILSVSLIAVSGTDHESYRFWHDPHNPYMRVLELLTTLLLRGAEAISRVMTYSLLLVTHDIYYIFIAIVCEISVFIIVPRNWIAIYSSPTSFFTRVGLELFDLCGTYHGLGSAVSGATGSSGASVLGSASMGDSTVKLMIKLIINAIILAFATEQLGQAGLVNFRQKFDSFGWIEACVLIGIMALASQLGLFMIRVELYRTRRRQMKSRSKNVKLAAWNIPLFDQTSRDFLREINDVLSECQYSAGDFIFRKGESDFSMHLLQHGEASMFAGTKSDRHPGSGWPMLGLQEMCEGRRVGKAMSLVLKGAIFGEQELLFMSNRSVNVVARTQCTTYALTRHSYDAIVGKYPADAMQIASNAERLVMLRNDGVSAAESREAIRPENGALKQQNATDSTSRTSAPMRIRSATGNSPRGASNPKISLAAAANLREDMRRRAHNNEYCSVARGRQRPPSVASLAKGTAVRLLELDVDDEWVGFGDGLKYDICRALQIEGRHVAMRRSNSSESPVVTFEVAVVPHKDDPIIDSFYQSRSIAQVSQELLLSRLDSTIPRERKKATSIHKSAGYVCLSLITSSIPLDLEPVTPLEGPESEGSNFSSASVMGTSGSAGRKGSLRFSPENSPQAAQSRVAGVGVEAFQQQGAFPFGPSSSHRRLLSPAGSFRSADLSGRSDATAVSAYLSLDRPAKGSMDQVSNATGDQVSSASAADYVSSASAVDQASGASVRSASPMEGQQRLLSPTFAAMV